MAEKIRRELAALDMAGTRFEVSFQTWPVDEGTDTHLMVDGSRIEPTGLDRIEYLIAPNVGEDLRPLAKIASGGEISRIMLALKSALSEVDNIPVMVFDEIDSGISGRIASVVGSELKNLSAKRQIICITHLPQIAAKGESHFSIEKTDSDEITNSFVKKLEFKERIPEIARLLGGETVTEINLLNAEEMLKEKNG